MLDKLQGSAYCSKIDLRSVYQQIQIRLEDEHKTTFKTTFALFEFVVMPFGLTNVTLIFTRMMSQIFCPHRALVGTFYDKYDYIFED